MIPTSRLLYLLSMALKGRMEAFFLQLKIITIPGLIGYDWFRCRPQEQKYGGNLQSVDIERQQTHLGSEINAPHQKDTRRPPVSVNEASSLDGNPPVNCGPMFDASDVQLRDRADQTSSRRQPLESVQSSKVYNSIRRPPSLCSNKQHLALSTPKRREA